MLLLGALLGGLVGALPAQGSSDEEYANMLQAAQRKLQKGELSAAEAAFQELLDAFAEEVVADRPKQAVVDEAQIGLLQIDLCRGLYEKVRDAVAGATPPFRARTDAAMLHQKAIASLGDYKGALEILEKLAAASPEDRLLRHELGELCARDGQRARARELWQKNAALPAPKDPVQLAYYGRSLWRLGGRDNFEAASRALVDSMAGAPDRKEARTTLGVLKFEAYGETGGFPSGEKDLKKVLENHGDDEEALLALYRIRSANPSLDGAKTERFLDRVIERNERSVEAIVLRAANILDDRRYRDAARMLDMALGIDANDRVALCHRAAAAWLMHEREDYAAFRKRALEGDPGWPEPDRILGDHLVSLYRFADAIPFYTAANVAA
ncbi:MAG TPA: hypothetical protein VFT55_17005, partial [Planctomycetota bacterium]|nr:hypothetical protein [Planctomycetota bacterium]